MSRPAGKRSIVGSKAVALAVSLAIPTGMGCTGALCAPTIAAGGPASEPAMTPSELVARYERALKKLPQPRRVSFTYSVEQLGPHAIVQTHRVYRAGSRERDEMLIDGSQLTVPAVRIFDDRVNRYDVLAVAPRSDAYAFRFVGRSGRMYLFKTTARIQSSFTVDELGIDEHSFLPAAVRFRISGGGARGSGELFFGRASRYWMVREARVTARLSDGARAQEQIAWSAYQFPRAFPPSTFQLPAAQGAGIGPPPTEPS